MPLRSLILERSTDHSFSFWHKRDEATFGGSSHILPSFKLGSYSFITTIIKYEMQHRGRKADSI
jgi:hypothetical protein